MGTPENCWASGRGFNLISQYLVPPHMGGFSMINPTNIMYVLIEWCYHEKPLFNRGAKLTAGQDLMLNFLYKM